MVSHDRVKDSLEHLQVLAERIRRSAEAPPFNANFLNVADAAAASENETGSIGSNISEFNSLACSLYSLFYKASDNQPESQLKLDLIKKNLNVTFPTESILLYVLFEMFRATIVLLPLYYWYKKVRREKIDCYISMIEETSAVLNGVYFEISNLIK